jgi:hypothetical protein
MGFLLIFAVGAASGASPMIDSLPVRIARGATGRVDYASRQCGAMGRVGFAVRETAPDCGYQIFNYTVPVTM